MEIDITEMANDMDHMPLLSGSVAELGASAARLTWANSQAYAAKHPLLTRREQFDAAREFIIESGGWTEEEVHAMPDSEVNSLITQWVAGDLRELESMCDEDGSVCWEAAEEMSHVGIVSGRIYPGDDGKVYFYMGA